MSCDKMLFYLKFIIYVYIYLNAKMYLYEKRDIGNLCSFIILHIQVIK